MNVGIRFFEKCVSYFSILALLMGLIATVPIANAAAGDHFSVTAAGSAVTMNAGDTLVFTVYALQSNNSIRIAITNGFLDLVDPSTFQPSTIADVTAVGGSLSLVSGDVDGASDNMIDFNMADSAAGTVTVKALSAGTFDLFVGDDATFINAPGAGDYPGADNWRITVAAGSGSPDHMVAAGPTANVEINNEFTVNLSQVNSNSGLDTAALADVGVALTGTATANITKVNGVTITPATSAADVALTSGLANVTIVATSTGSVIVTPSSATLGGSDVADTTTAVSAVATSVKGYGPPAGDTNVPLFAPVDFFVNKDITDVSFPLTNSASSVVSLVATSGGAAVAGTWEKFTESWGSETFYMLTFFPSAGLIDSTQYTASIDKTLASTLDLQGGMPTLTDATTKWSFNFTTGSGGGSFTVTDGSGGAGGGFTGTMGGEVPPMAFLGYPMPGEYDVPTNIGCVSVMFDRPMDATTFSGISIKKMVNGSETAASGTPTFTPSTGTSDNVCIGGYSFSADSEYRVVVPLTVTDTKGNGIAGMPLDQSGDPSGGFGFGFDNMGSFKESFHTGAGSVTVTATYTGSNLDAYTSGANIVNVPPGFIPGFAFDAPLNQSTVTAANVTCKKNGITPVAGAVEYDAFGNFAEFVPSTVLEASTSYTCALSTSVQSISGTAITAVTKTFTTGSADSMAPQLVFGDCDNYGCFMQFDEGMSSTTVENTGFYTLYTCTQQGVTNSSTCATSGTPSAVSLFSANAFYESFGQNVFIDGVTLTPGDGFLVELTSGVTDASGNAINTSNDTWSGFVQDASKFFGGQGMQMMDSMGFEDFNMTDMGMNPVGAWPMSPMASATTKYFIDIPVGQLVPSGGTIELTFPTGFDISGAKQDAQSPVNADFNGPSTGTVTFAGSDPSGTGITAGGGGSSDGIGVIAGARKVIIELSAASQASDFLTIDLDGIQNPATPKDAESSGYQVQIQTKDTTGVVMEALSSMPFFISAGGSNTVSGSVCTATCNGSNGLNGVEVFIDSPMTGFQEATTANNAAGGGNDGEYQFTGLPDGYYGVFTEPTFTVSATDYYGQDWPEPLDVTSNVTKNIVVSAANGTNGATQEVRITAANLGGITSLGFNDSLDVFAASPQGFIVKTLTRTQLTNHIADPVTNPINMYLNNSGMWQIGIGPSIPHNSFEMPDFEWMPPQPQDVNVTTSDIGGSALAVMNIVIGDSSESITGKVTDKGGTAIANAKVFAYNPELGIGNESTTKQDGTFSLPITQGLFKVGSFLPGMPLGKEYSALVDATNVYIDGNPTASTGSTGANAFVIQLSTDLSNSVTVSGRVTDGNNALSGAGVWAYRTDAPSPPVDGFTDDSGNYVLYMPSSGSWQIEAHAPQYGFLGTKSVTIGTDNITGQNFEPADASTLGTFTGTIDVPGTADDSGVMVWVYGANGGNDAMTQADGSFSIDVPAGSYTVEAYIPGKGELPSQSATATGGESTAVSFGAVAAFQSFTVTLSTAVDDDTFMDMFSTTGVGTSVLIPAGETVVEVTVPQGEYFINLDTPFDETNAVVAGAEINNVNSSPSTDDKIDIDGTGDDITVTMPTLQTLSGTVEDTGTGVENVTVTLIDESTKDTFNVQTDSSGDYTMKVPDGSYTVFAEQPGYSAAPKDITISGGASANNDFALDAFDKSISGTITDANNNAVDGALVYATQGGGGFMTAETDSNGDYTMYVSDGQWNVKAVTDGFDVSAGIVGDTSSSIVIDADITLPVTTVTLEDPVTKPLTPSSGGTIEDEDLGVEVFFPPNSLGNGNSSNTVSVEETNAVATTATGDPVGNGMEVTAKDSSGTPITTLNDEMKLTFDLSLAELATEGIDTPTEAAQMTVGYWNDTTGNWNSEATSIVYYNSSDVVIPGPTVAASGTLSAAGVAKVELSSASIDHLTTFAPIVPSGTNPPATPTGLAVTTTNAAATLTWTANTEGDMSYYKIWEANITAGTISTLLHSACVSTVCTATVSGLTNTLVHAFQIIAVNTAGDESSGSTAVNGTPNFLDIDVRDPAPVVEEEAAEPAASSGGGGGISSATDTASADDVDAEETEATAEADAEDASSEDSEDDSKVLAAVTEREDVDPAGTDYEGHWAQNFIIEIVERGIASGDEDGDFEPDRPINRAELVKMVVIAMGLDVPETLEEAPFSDVAVDDWFAPFVQVVKDEGIIIGYADGTFKPNKDVNRAEVMKILVLGVLGVDEDSMQTDESPFPDVALSDWFAPFVKYAFDHDMVSGYNDGTFGPGNQMTRAELSKVLLRAIDQQV